MKKLTSLEDTATITITGREAVWLATLTQKSNGNCDLVLYRKLKNLLPEDFNWSNPLESINYLKVKHSQESRAFPTRSKENLDVERIAE